MTKNVKNQLLPPNGIMNTNPSYFWKPRSALDPKPNKGTLK